MSLTCPMGICTQIGKVQFYLSDNIELKRQISAEQQIDDNEKGRFTIEDGKTYEVYRFRKGLAGVAESEDGEVIRVRFEAGADMLLTFQLTPLTDTETLRFYRLKVEEGNTTYADRSHKARYRT